LGFFRRGNSNYKRRELLVDRKTVGFGAVDSAIHKFRNQHTLYNDTHLVSGHRSRFEHRGFECTSDGAPRFETIEGRQTFDPLTHEVEHHRIRRPHFPFNHNLPANQTELLLEQVSSPVRSFLRARPLPARSA
jgi:hypothetical protein